MLNLPRLSCCFFALSLASGLYTVGCQQEKYPEDLFERGKLITKLRRQAREQFETFQRSEGKDLEALQAYSDLHHETTKISPGDCPRCFAEYGASLSRLGIYYETLVKLTTEEYARAAKDQRPAILAKLKEHRRKVREYYTQSNQQFEVYFQNGQVDPRTYRWVFQQSAALGDYRKALYYLDLYTHAVKLSEVGEENAEALRKRYERGFERQRDAEFEAEIAEDEEEGGLSFEDLEVGN